MQPKAAERLETTFAGVKMRSPIGIAPMNSPMARRASITPERHAEVLLKHAEAGAGYVYIPRFNYITREMLAELGARATARNTPPRPEGNRWLKIETPGYGVEGLYYFSMTSTTMSDEKRVQGFDAMRKVLEILKKKLPAGVAIIASVTPLGDFPESAVMAAKKAEELGVDLIEVNVGCGLLPSVEGAIDYYLDREFPLLFCGSLVGDHPDLVEKIAREVIKAVKTPVGVKMTSETGFPRLVGLARNLREAGVKYIEINNFAPTIAPPDIYNRGRSRWPCVDGNPFVAGTGSWLRMGCYKNVAGVAKFSPGIAIAASGGLMTPEHAIEVMMLGAGLAEFCTGLLFQGRNLLRRTTRFLEKFMDEQGYESIKDIVGIGVQYIEPCDTVEFHPDSLVAEVDPAGCNGCWICTDHVCLAMTRENGVAVVREEDCQGCGLCVVTCPRGTIRLRPRAKA